ncbi:MAG TPA: hypothetical protein VFQ44_23870 [Streptosporangiaceae bacterium]|nr:hypothetical protein [Streptosporangiaceae bacterium]
MAACGLAAVAIATALAVGLAAASIVVLGGAAIALVAARTLIGPYNRAAPPPEIAPDATTTSFLGWWRTQTDLADASKSMSTWDHVIKPRLQRLLAARLAEHHGVSLAADPQAAREIFIGENTRGGAALWYWIDPERPGIGDAEARAGIPPRVLAALIQRLEQL